MKYLLFAGLLALAACSADAITTTGRGSAIDMQGSGLTVADWGIGGINIRNANMPGVVRK